MGPQNVDWERLERSAEFRELVARRRRFVLPATVFFLSWYLGFVLLSGYAEGFMGEYIVDGLTVGYALALSQFLMVAVLGIAYLRYSERVLDPVRERLVASVERAATDDDALVTAGSDETRFARGPTTATSPAGEVRP
jgi:uncharacterized membrane protein (DUF485 family)